MLQFITDSFFHTPLLLLMLAFALVDIRKDQKNIPWLLYLPFGLATFSLLYLAYQHRAIYEYRILHTYFPSYNSRWNWDTLFRHIPFNNGWLFRLWQPHWLTLYFSFVYRTAFYLNLWTAVIRGFFVKDIKKMIRYMLAGIVLQMIIVYPFYYSVLLQEVWFVQGDPDMLARHLSHTQLLNTVADCFPSLHTSTAFAVLLLALRERGKLFKWMMVIDCGSIIIATLYLKIHWMLDVFAGMLLAYVMVKLVDWLLDSLCPLLWSRLVRAKGGKSVPLVQSEL